jgi:dienelactone hydrolase
MIILPFLVISTAGIVAGALGAEAPAKDPPPATTTGPWPPDSLFASPEMEWLNRAEPVHALLYDAEIYRGQPTQVFAWYATPATLESKPTTEGRRFPGIVLIHGGGGTAFKEWVELWARRGYAAIAMDLAGSRPSADDPRQVTRLERGGPPQDDAAKFESIRTDDVTDDWPYHAVANVIRAHSLLRSFPEVDADRTAATGISWGGYVCCLAASLDERFKAAVPVYGCGFLHENSVWLPQFAKLGPALTKKWAELYDPSSYLPRCRTPLFFVNGTNDFAYPLDSYAKTLRAAGPAMDRVRIEVDMPHGHDPGWAPAEIGLYVDSLLRVGDVPLLPKCSLAEDDGGRVTAFFEAKTAIRSAELHYSVPGEPINKRKWETRPATVRGRAVHAEWLPPEADAFFVTLTDERGAMMSSPASLRDAITVFDAPAIQEVQMRVMQQFAQLAQAKNHAAAERLLTEAVRERQLNNAVNHYNLACTQALLGQPDAALESLAAAIDRGWNAVKHMQEDADLASLRDKPRFAELVQAAEANTRRTPARGPKPAPVKDGIALVSEANTAWAPQVLQFLVLHEFPKPEDAKEITTLKGGVGDLLRTWQAEKTAAGLAGFLYDNHDRDHSNMDFGSFPQLTRIEYADPVRKRPFDHGLQHLFLHSAPTIGNSSTANVGGPYWGSQTRMALRQPRTANVLALQYSNNHIYFYPEHRDHDADGHGDVFHANTPYVITSQGSSGSDRPFMDAVACALAAFRPETQRALTARKLLAPTVQMLLRSTQKTVRTPDDYVTGRAHPSVFDAQTLDVERMVRAAHEMKPGEVPGLIKLRVVEEDEPEAGVEFFEAGPGEKLFDTGCAIARVVRSSRWERRIVVSAEETRDPNGRALTFQWRLLRGDPERVRITPLDETGTRAELRVAWHDRRPIEPGSEILSSRVDVGVFAHNGAHYSAPAFVSWHFPASEKRVYNDAQRIVSIERFSPQEAEHYADPALVTPGVWRDEYRYDAEGRLLGWVRTRKDATEEFTRHGALVVRKDDLGRPSEARRVRYVRRQAGPQAWPELEQQTTDERLTYTYTSNEDRLGEMSVPGR